MNTRDDAPGQQVLRIRYGDKVILFEVCRQPMRSQQRLSIHVDPDDRVSVDAPPEVEVGQLLDGVRRRARWINQQLEGFRIQRAYAVPHEYASGRCCISDAAIV